MPVYWPPGLPPGNTALISYFLIADEPPFSSGSVNCRHRFVEVQPSSLLLLKFASSLVVFIRVFAQRLIFGDKLLQLEPCLHRQLLCATSLGLLTPSQRRSKTTPTLS